MAKDPFFVDDLIYRCRKFSGFAGEKISVSPAGERVRLFKMNYGNSSGVVVLTERGDYILEDGDSTHFDRTDLLPWGSIDGRHKELR